MAKRTIYPILTFVIIGLAGFLYAQNVYRQNKAMGGDYTTTTEYNASIDYSCKKDSDCVVKDVHNCCGEYLRCANKDAKVDGDFVEKACAKEGIGSLCGYPEIKGCKCADGICKNT
ncbi:MAG TPA: hypothetical protein PLF30_00125 [Candidatus Moranbacteria bacterium]|jgi:hypothetical protein|nr:hypothetical protein [Candidatus Moranbacteria bacterium]HPX93963.1 hypothetical protein [Candidatus Moranbacteria bacterium]HQB59310.1 hypothetical protein [Candidatus Moranbacteria bacterium]